MIGEYAVCPRCKSIVPGGLDEHACPKCGYRKPAVYNRYEGRLFRASRMPIAPMAL